MEKWVTFSPSTLEFHITINRQSSTQLVLKNISKETLAYKVKTTCVQRYSVRPSASSVYAGEEIVINFCLRAFNDPPPDLNNCQDRFLLLITPLSAAPPASELSISDPMVDDQRNLNEMKQYDDESFHGYKSVADFWAAVHPSAIIKEKIPVCLRLVTGVNDVGVGDVGVSEEFDSKETSKMITSSTKEINGDDVGGQSFVHVKPFMGGVDVFEGGSDHIIKKEPIDSDANARLKLVSPTGVVDIANAVTSHLVENFTSFPNPKSHEKTTSQSATASLPVHPSTSGVGSEQDKIATMPNETSTLDERVPNLPEEPCIVLRRSDAAVKTPSPSTTPHGDASAGTKNRVTAETVEIAPASADLRNSQGMATSETTEDPQPWPPASTSTENKNSSQPATPPEKEIDYSSVEYARERELQMNVSHPVNVPELDHEMRQRVAVERAGELQRVINEKTKLIESVHRDLVEARHRLSDARMATRPSYDVRYELNESGRIPIAQICIMAIISGALLQLLL